MCQKNKLLKKLHELEQEMDDIEYYQIPKVLKQLHELNLTDAEIKNHGLDTFHDWKILNS